MTHANSTTRLMPVMPMPSSRHAKRQALGAFKPRGHRPQRGSKCSAISGLSPVVTLERIPPPEPCREQDELHLTHGPIPGGKSLCSTGRENPGPCRRSQPLHRFCNTRHCARRVSLSKESGSALTPHFVQQSRNLDLSLVLTTLSARLCHCPFRRAALSSRVLIDIVPDFKCSL